MADAATAAAAAAFPPPRAQQGRQLLQPIADQLGTPGGAKIAREAKRRGVRVTKEEIKRFLATKGQKQIFRPLPRSQGKSASESLDFRFQMDLIALPNSPSNGNRYILVIVNVFTRRLYAAPISNKRAETVAVALDDLLAQMPSRPAVIFVDRGSEWSGAVERLLAAKGIIQRARADPGDVNALGVVDRLILNVKTRLAESLAANPGEWAERLAQIVAQYNATPHDTLHDTAPNEVRRDETLQFLLLQDNARKLKHNSTLLQTRKAALEEAGAFRRPVGGLTRFKRGFRASYGDVEQLRGFTGSLAQPTSERAPVDVKRLLPVDRDTGDVQETFALNEGRRDREIKRRQSARATPREFRRLRRLDAPPSQEFRRLRRLRDAPDVLL